MTDFQKNWLRFSGIIVILFGIAIALMAFPATEAPMRLFFTVLGNPIPADPGDHFRFAMGLMGFISVGWGMTLMVAFETGYHLTGHAATRFWRGILFAVGVWYVTDGFASIATGFWRNVISNSLLVIMLMIPILSSGVLKNAKET
jgi:hypothetical protein